MHRAFYSSRIKSRATRYLINSIFRQYFRKQNRKVSTSQLARIDVLEQRFPDSTEWQRRVICDVESSTMTSPERILSLCEATNYIVKHKIEGAIVECGVWRGGSMAAVAKTLYHHKVNNRQLWMYDTYEGMTTPTGLDVDFRGRSASELMNAEQSRAINRDDPESIWCRSALEGVKKTMASTGYAIENMHFIKGMVEETIPLHTPEKIALLRLDTDWYESTKCELEYLFPKIVPGGVFIVDDYGHWAGCRQAVDEYFDKHGIKMMLNRIDYTGRIGIVASVENSNRPYRDMEAAA